MNSHQQFLEEVQQQLDSLRVKPKPISKWYVGFHITFAMSSMIAGMIVCGYLDACVLDNDITTHVDRFWMQLQRFSYFCLGFSGMIPTGYWFVRFLEASAQSVENRR